MSTIMIDFLTNSETVLRVIAIVLLSIIVVIEAKAVIKKRKEK